MKASRFLIVMAVAVAAVGFNYAFHSGGVAECEGCHSMHHPKSSNSLLVGTDASSACLSCHENAADTAPSSYHVSTAGVSATKNPIQRTPGGDFGWLKKTYSWGTSATAREDGESHGHNIVAFDYGYVAHSPGDPPDPNGPGGTFPKSALGCQSCHDPHGKARQTSAGFVATGAPIIASGSYDNSPAPTDTLAVGVYRILYGAASPDKPAGASFSSYPVAIAPATYNRSEAVTQTRVAYGGGALANSWGEWCGTCHGAFKGESSTHHPADGPMNGLSATYNAYVSSGIMTGNAATAYLSIVPFAEGTTDLATLKSHANMNGSYLQGPTTSDAVTCLSCHRAHASGFKEALRFYYQWEFMTYDGKYPGLDNTSMTSTRKATQASGRNMIDFKDAYYDREPTFVGPYNRVLCNKCHAQD